MKEQIEHLIGDCFGREWVEANKQALDGICKQVVQRVPTEEEQRRDILRLVATSLYGGGISGKALLDDEGLCLVIYKKDGVPMVAVCEKNEKK
jgi:hypothetical protein